MKCYTEPTDAPCPVWKKKAIEDLSFTWKILFFNLRPFRNTDSIYISFQFIIIISSTVRWSVRITAIHRQSIHSFDPGVAPGMKRIRITRDPRAIRLGKFRKALVGA